MYWLHVVGLCSITWWIMAVNFQIVVLSKSTKTTTKTTHVTLSKMNFEGTYLISQ